MSTTRTNILVTGATGYIGGSVLSRFLARSDISSLNITALIRSPEKAAKVKALGVHAVVGSHEDGALLEKLASEADVVLSIADSDYIPAAKAMLRGLEKRHKATGTAPVLIHTSGTGVLMDDARGLYSTDTIYDDANTDQIETLVPTQLHRDVDLLLLDADRLGYVKTYIILPCTIYGIATGKLVELGVQNPHSIQIPALINAALGRGQGGMVGEGKNMWGNVSNDDVADLYPVLYDAIKTNPATGHGRQGYYFAENGEHSLYGIGKAIAEALVALGRGKSAEPTTFTEEEIDKYFRGTYYLGTNSRSRANHSRAIGWKSVHTTADMLASIKPEIEALLRKKSTV